MKTRIPTIAEFKAETLALMKEAVTNSDQMRQRLSKCHGVDLEMLRVQAPERAHQFVNNHAWALVWLQNEGRIEKLGTQEYGLTARHNPESAFEPPMVGRMPRWAKTLISGANARNRKRFLGNPELTQEDLIALWRECGGQCAVTGLQFSNDKVGLGKAKRAFAPSLDRIDPAIGYSRENCRLVMVAVNFAMNSWGEETYLHLAEAAVKRAGSKRH